MKIKVINPVLQTEEELREEEHYIQGAVRPGVQIELACLQNGFPSVESELSHAVNTGELAAQLLRQDLSEFDGVFVNCFDDPGVLACREALTIPICGGYVPSMLTAMFLGDRIGIITTDPRCIPNEKRKARAYGFEHRLAAVGCVSIPVTDLLSCQDQLLQALADECERLYTKQQTDAICLGCTVMARVWQGLQQELRRRGCPVRVVEPMKTGLYWLENMVQLQYTNSLGLHLDLDHMKWAQGQLPV